MTRASPRSPSGSSPPATAASSALLDCEDELLALAGAIEIAHFPEASRAMVDGPVRPLARRGLDHDAARRRAHPARCGARPERLVTIGACATAGGIQALRNFADVDEFISAVYATPEYISTLATSTPISDHVQVDFELRGCPIDKRQLLEVHQRLPARPPAARSPRTASASSASAAATSA